MPEDTFRKHMDWPRNQQFDQTMPRSHNWVKDYVDSDGQYRRAAVYQGHLASMTVQEWENILIKQPRLATRGYFSIHFDDPSLPWESDIRYLPIGS